MYLCMKVIPFALARKSFCITYILALNFQKVKTKTETMEHITIIIC